jgi:hypothetical protein
MCPRDAPGPPSTANDRRRMNNLTIADLKGPSKQLAEELVRVLLADEPTGEEPLAGILEYALRALVTNNIHPVLVPGQEVRWTSG